MSEFLAVARGDQVALASATGHPIGFPLPELPERGKHLVAFPIHIALPECLISASDTGRLGRLAVLS